MSVSRTPLVAAAALVTVTAMWGSTFSLTKDLTTRVPVFDYLALRFTVAGLVLGLVFVGQLRALPAQAWRRSIVLGALYGAGQVLQTIGLAQTSAAVSGFITGMYVVLTPIVAWWVLHHVVEARTWVAVAVATTGLGVMSLQGWKLGPGETLTLLATVVYAAHIVWLGEWSRREQATGLAVVQLLVMGALCWPFALAHGVTVPTQPGDLAAFAYMTLITGGVALVLQTWAQAHITATQAALIMALEPVFAALFATWWGGETLTVRMAWGGALVVIAMVLAVPRTRITSPPQDGLT